MGEHFWNVADRLVKLAESDDRLIRPQGKIKRDAFRDVVGEPPARVTSARGGLANLRLQPVAVELEELPRIGAEVGKFFLKRDHFLPVH